jgi:hypothetical protein
MRVRPMTYFDVRVVANIGKETFANDELFAWLYPFKDQYPNDSARWQLLRLRTRIVERGSHGFVCETEAGDDGWDAAIGSVIVGYTFFIVKGSGEEAQKWRTEPLLNSKSCLRQCGMIIPQGSVLIVACRDREIPARLGGIL